MFGIWQIEEQQNEWKNGIQQVNRGQQQPRRKDKAVGDESLQRAKGEDIELTQNRMV